MLGKVTRQLAEAGINLTTVYLATDTRVVLGCENLSALETAWKELAASRPAKPALSGRPVIRAVRARL
jgi:hypothetical protein